MTTLMQRLIRRLAEVPESEQDRVARRLLSLPELATAEQEAAERKGAASPPSLVSILSEPSSHARSKAEIDQALSDLRDEWDR